MKKKTLKLKKFNIHPIFMFIILSCITVLLSWILSVLQVQVTYNKINPNPSNIMLNINETVDTQYSISDVNQLMSDRTLYAIAVDI